MRFPKGVDKRNMSQMKEQNKTPGKKKKTKQIGNKQRTRFRVQNTGYTDAQ